MDIIEAIKSGKPFKHKEDHQWIANWKHGHKVMGLRQLASDDWEIMPEPEQKIELSWKQIDEVLSLDFNGPIRDWKKEIKRKLGFEE